MLAFGRLKHLCCQLVRSHVTNDISHARKHPRVVMPSHCGLFSLDANKLVTHNLHQDINIGDMSDSASSSSAAALTFNCCSIASNSQSKDSCMIA